MRINLANYSINSDETRLELDSNADNTVLGKGFLVVRDFYWTINVTGYYPEDGSNCFRIVKCFLDYDHPQTGKPYFMVINKSIHLDHLEHH